MLWQKDWAILVLLQLQQLLLVSLSCQRARTLRHTPKKLNASLLSMATGFSVRTAVSNFSSCARTRVETAGRGRCLERNGHVTTPHTYVRTYVHKKTRLAGCLNARTKEMRARRPWNAIGHAPPFWKRNGTFWRPSAVRRPYYALPNVFTMSFYHPWQPLVNCAAAFAICLLLRSGQINIPRQRHARVPV